MDHDDIIRRASVLQELAEAPLTVPAVARLREATQGLLAALPPGERPGSNVVELHPA